MDWEILVKLVFSAALIIGSTMKLLQYLGRKEDKAQKRIDEADSEARRLEANIQRDWTGDRINWPEERKKAGRG